jgi:hypothetical protein
MAATAPEVRQCLDPEDDLFGSVAVRAGENSWGVMNPGVVNPNARGGHWATDAEVASWGKPPVPDNT